mmetsp:Transcript_2422/g.6515  ORF Transcript_2422/g.6515 Transcript_2422/m.6515 type:complete len:228 (+) Transcript_2422:1090-1773(+)
MSSKSPPSFFMGFGVGDDSWKSRSDSSLLVAFPNMLPTPCGTDGKASFRDDSIGFREGNGASATSKLPKASETEIPSALVGRGGTRLAGAETANPSRPVRFPSLALVGFSLSVATDSEAPDWVVAKPDPPAASICADGGVSKLPNPSSFSPLVAPRLSPASSVCAVNMSSDGSAASFPDMPLKASETDMEGTEPDIGALSADELGTTGAPAVRSVTPPTGPKPRRSD